VSKPALLLLLPAILQELYPAPTDVWAAPVTGDAPDVRPLRQLLASTQLEAAPLRLAYDAARDGWGADSFHARVDGFGTALVVAETGGRARLSLQHAGASRGRCMHACRLPMLHVLLCSWRRAGRRVQPAWVGLTG
jgi:hypothetical protein